MIPSENQIDAIPLARAGEFELNEREIKQTRQMVYRKNRDGRSLYRTIKHGRYLMVWRIQ